MQLHKRPEWNLGKREVPDCDTIMLPEGRNGNLETIKQMIKLARENSGHPKIRQLAVNILNSVHTLSHNFLDEAAAIGIYVQKNIEYLRDPNGIEQITHPLTMLDMIQRGVARGDCDDMALFIATLLLTTGHSPFFRTARYKGTSGPYQHIYVVVYDKNHKGQKQRLVLDAIIKDKKIGFEVPQVSGDEFEV